MTEGKRLPPEGKLAVTPSKCQHEFVFLRSAKWAETSGGYNDEYFRLDTFFCSKCLEQKEVKKSECCRATPDWYRGE